MTDRIPSPTGGTDRVGPDAHLLHALFEQSARAHPAAVALSFDRRELTYAQLDEAANRLAGHLRDHFGIGPEQRVGIMVGRSERMVIGILAILKAGAAYVPIDPRYPAAVVRELIEGAPVSAFLVDAEHVAPAAAVVSRVFIMDVELDGLPANTFPTPVAVDPANVAYIIHTSGSTGRRKGVQVEHRAITNTLRWRHRYYGLDPSMVTLQIPSYALDSSVVDIFSTLGCGGRLVILREDARTDLRYIPRLLRAHQVTHLVVTPTLYRILLPETRDVPSLRTVTLAGEAVTPDLIARHYAVHPRVRLVNEYGPTENAVCSTAGELDPGGERVSIGQGITGVLVRLLDDQLRPVPPDGEGEIYLGGVGLARGYVGRPGLTADRFVPDPLASTPGARLYRTGDRARRLADGTLEFQGRTDDEVKIRGHRVELGEVERALRALDWVNDAVVVCRPDAQGHDHLVGYVVENAPVDPTALREALAQAVPGFMVPDAIVVIERIPMTVNGKVDRAALPDPKGMLDQGADGAVAPQSAAEQEMAAIWSSILNVGRPGVRDDFFALGGNSLKAAQLQLEIHTRFGFDIALHKILEYSTIQKLAAAIGERLGATTVGETP